MSIFTIISLSSPTYLDGFSRTRTIHLWLTVSTVLIRSSQESVTKLFPYHDYPASLHRYFAHLHFHSTFAARHILSIVRILNSLSDFITPFTPHFLVFCPERHIYTQDHTCILVFGSHTHTHINAIAHECINPSPPATF